MHLDRGRCLLDHLTGWYLDNLGRGWLLLGYVDDFGGGLLWYLDNLGGWNLLGYLNNLGGLLLWHMDYLGRWLLRHLDNLGRGWLLSHLDNSGGRWLLRYLS